MNILSMRNEELFDDPNLQYCGRSNFTLGLGNPWGYKGQMRQAMFACNSKKDSLNNYREWLDKLLCDYLLGMGLVGIFAWEQKYLSKVIKLAFDIQEKKITSLGCWCINVENYLPVPDGLEKCHVEILYKGCLRIINYKQQGINK